MSDNVQVLAVDDDSPARTTLREMLKRTEFKLVVVDTPLAFREKIESGGKWGAFIIDAGLPRLGAVNVQVGLSLAHFVRQTHPKTCVIIVSGFHEHEDAIKSCCDEIKNASYLFKPFDRRKLRELLAVMTLGETDVT